MSKLHRVTIGERSFHAKSGQVLLDAALMSGVDLPHDCKAGRCGACLTRVRSGITLGGQSEQPGMVHACQAMVFSSLDLELEPTPPLSRVRASVTEITEIGEEIVEVVMRPARPLTMLPGQYCRFRFRGFPARPFSPTAPMRDIRDDGLIRLHVKRVRDGKVTPQLGRSITSGHMVTIEGPLGHAYLRHGLDNRLVLVASGTGFAPVWALAAAALRENPTRRIVLIAAARKLSGFYMSPALNVVRSAISVGVVGCVEELGRRAGPFLPGKPLEHLPALTADDVVYGAGAPALVEAVGAAARHAGAAFYADPFHVVHTGAPPRETPGLIERARAWLAAS